MANEAQQRLDREARNRRLEMESGGCPSEDEMQAEETIANLEATIERLAQEKADLLVALQTILSEIHDNPLGFKDALSCHQIRETARAAIARVGESKR